MSCPDGKIRNPKTGRCVKIDGRIGKQIAKSIKTSSLNNLDPHPKSKRVIDDAISKPKVTTPSPVTKSKVASPEKEKSKTSSINYASPIEEKSALKPLSIHFVLGLGCSLSKHDNNHFKHYLENLSKAKRSVIHCNESLKQVLGDIAKVNIKVKLKQDKFVSSVYDSVIKDIDNGYRVLLLGHSYGGSVVARIAEIANNSFNKRLVIKTFGSIYIPSFEKTKNAHVEHFIFTDDVCLKCNKLQNLAHHDQVTWLSHDYSPGVSFFQKLNPFGSKKQWLIHNSYENHITDNMNKWALFK